MIHVEAGSLTVGKLAEAVGRPLKTAYGWVTEGKVAAQVIRRGRKQNTYLVSPAEVDRVKGLVAADLPVVAELSVVNG